jgi:hypothetical protein
MVPADVCDDMGIEAPSRQLVDGSVPGIRPGYGSITIDNISLGDLDGDAVADGAVVFGCSGGGTMYVNELVVYLAASPDSPVLVDVPSPVTTQNQGYSPLIETTAISDGELTATWKIWSGSDPHCCPSLRVTTTWTVDEGGATLVS